MSVESPAILDTCFAELPLYQTLGDQLHSTFTALRPYEGFASDVSERVGNEDRYAEQKSNLKKGLFYFLTFTVEYDSGELTNTHLLHCINNLLSTVSYKASQILNHQN